jgi:DNA-binding response OmpR family regulator
MRILVIDDELDTAQTVALLLRNEGHEVRYAVTAGAALDLVKENEPQLVILDLGLPDMDGLELARRLKHRDKGAAAAPKIIAITGRGAETRVAALKAGCDHFLQKPVDPGVLYSLIDDPH